MGLFNRGNKKTPQEEYEEQYNSYLAQIEAANCVVQLDLAVDTYGNDDIIAGAMIGETGKYLMMNKYGDYKWDTTTLAIRNDGIEIHYAGLGILYTDVLAVQVGETKGLLNVEKQMTIATRQGNYVFKSNTIFIDVVVNLIRGMRDRYNGWVRDGLITPGEDLTMEEWDKLIAGEPLDRKKDTKNDNGSDVEGNNLDRVLRAGELHERGLLSDEEFMDIKNKYLKHDEPVESDELVEDIKNGNFCPSCGAEIDSSHRFCTNCGHELQ